MTQKTSLFRGAAFGVFAAVAVSAGANAAPHHHHAAKAAAGGSERGEIAALRAEVQELKARLDATSATQVATSAQAQQAVTAAQDAQQQVAEAQQADADATAAVIQSIPTQVAAQAEAFKPKTDGFYFKGVKITPGGFLEAASIYRSKNLGNDVATNFNSIPYGNSRTGNTSEFRETAKQSRISGLVEGAVNPDLKLSFYGEFDFQAAAQTANSNEANSFNLRIRNLYGTADFADEGWHILAGQSWSLVTLNSKGISPRNEVTPAVIDAQYVPGFDWARQPQIRVTKDLFDKHLWLALSVENPATTSYVAGLTGNTAAGTGAASLPSTVVTSITGNGNAFNSANQVSLNHVPDAVAKAAYETTLFDRALHLEGLVLFRDFYDRIGSQTDDQRTFGFGGGVTFQAIPGLIDLQASGLTGKGIGRYGSGQLPDVTFRPDGRIEPVTETMFLVGGTVHATKMLDIYGYAGEEHENRKAFGSNFGYGNVNYDNVGCYTEGSAGCVGNTRILQQATLGAWQKLYQGGWGRVQVGLQYSYTERRSFSGFGGAPTASDNIFFASFRYYPF